MNLKISLYILLIAFILLVSSMVFCLNKMVNWSVLFGGISCVVCCVGFCFSLRND